MWDSVLRTGDLITLELDFTCDICLVLDIDRVEDTVIVLNSRLGRKEMFVGEWLGTVTGAVLQSRPALL